MSKHRVVVTGLGMLTPLGADVAGSWDGLISARSGIAPITSFDISSFPVRFGGSVPEFDMDEFLAPKEARRMDGFVQFGLVAGMQAMADAGLEVTEENRDSIGVAVGSGMGGIVTVENTHSTLLNKGPNRVSPFSVPGSVINMIAGHLSIMFGLRGPNVAVAAACTTGVHNIGLGARMIAYGEAQAMLVGGAEKATSPTTMAGFAAMKALSRRNQDPEGASRPWDRGRDGFVLSDGASVLVLEEYEAARARGARVYCEVVGFGMSADALHITSPPENGEGAELSMRNALQDAAMNPDEIQYINAHGTSTPLGDVAETRAIKAVMGDAAKKVAVSSTKSMLGHALGAAGSIEAVISILALRKGVVPPTINLDDPDEECDLDYVPRTARDLEIDAVLTNSFGFGGTNGTLIFRRV